MIFDIAMGILLALAILAGIGLVIQILLLAVCGIGWCMWRALAAMRYVIEFMCGGDPKP